MATPKITLVPVVLDKARNLRLDFNALAEAEQLTGKNFLNDDTWKNMTASDVRALMFSALRHEDDKLTLQEVGALLDPSSMGEIVLALGLAYEGALPEKKEEGSGKDPLPVTLTP